jgi:hypothetical protein
MRVVYGWGAGARSCADDGEGMEGGWGGGLALDFRSIDRRRADGLEGGPVRWLNGIGEWDGARGRHQRRVMGVNPLKEGCMFGLRVAQKNNSRGR